MTDLTEQWKKGELPDGYYYCKLILNNMKPSVERCKAHCIPMGVSADKGEEVLAPVPSYEELQNMNEAVNQAIAANIKLVERVKQLEGLLKECREVIKNVDTYYGNYDSTNGYLVINKIDEALK